MRLCLYVLAVMFAFSIFGGCAKTPQTLLYERYKNLNEYREIETLHEDKHVVVLVGSKKGEKCDEVETVIYNNINADKSWKLFRARNDRKCKSDRENRVQERYLEWLKTKNSME